MMLLLFVFNTIISLTYSGSITCNNDNDQECSYQKLNCSSINQTQDCVLNCLGPNACDTTQFSCQRDTKSCRINCQGTDSCTNMILYTESPHAEINCGTIDSEDVGACSQININMNITDHASGSSVNCGSTEDSCYNAIINISASDIYRNDVEFRLNCYDIGSSGVGPSCGGLIYNCNLYSGLCELSCTDGEDSCYLTEIYCLNGASCTSNYEVPIYTSPPSVMPTSEPRYIYIDQPLEWINAEEYCINNFHTHLATIITDNDDTLLQDAIGNININAWIGLNDFHGSGWNWIDGSSCDYMPSGLCEDDPLLIAPPPLTCAHVHIDRYSAESCMMQFTFLCNLLPITDYLCMYDSDNNDLVNVFHYHYFFTYSGLDGVQLQWLNDEYAWHLSVNGSIEGNCNSTMFKLPNDCNNWMFWANSRNNVIRKCPLFNDVCVVSSDNMTSVAINDTFLFKSFDYTEYGAIYQSISGNIDIYPHILNDTHGEYIIDDGSGTQLYCYLIGGGILDITKCVSWFQLNILTSTELVLCPTLEPTKTPTNEPTIVPTNIPTSIPSQIPTYIPTGIPTNEPTLIPSFSPTFTLPTVTTGFYSSETLLMTNFETINSVGNTINISAANKEKVLSSTFQVAFVLLILTFIIILIISYIFAKKIDRNDFFRPSAIISIPVNMMDILSDIFFSILISFYVNNEQIFIIFILSICFILIPVIITIYQLFHEMRKHWLKKDKLRAWIAQHTKLLYITSILCGSSFAAVDLYNSNLFSLSLFDMGLSKQELLSYQTKRVYSIVLLENIPQLALQIWYTAQTSGKFSLITVTSLVFTLISIIVAIISMITRKRIIFDQDIIIIEYDVTGHIMIKKSEININKTSKLRDQVAIILGLNKDLISFEKPINIPNGLRIHLNIRMNDNIKTDTVGKLEKLMYIAIENGQLSETMNNSWHLGTKPNINNLNCNTKYSKKKVKLSIIGEHIGMKQLKSISDFSDDVELEGKDIKQTTTDNNIDESDSIHEDNNDLIKDINDYHKSKGGQEGNQITKGDQIVLQENEFIVNDD